jgi:hypothetical protein
MEFFVAHSCLFLLLQFLPCFVDSHAVDFTCPNYPELVPGIAVHGLPAISDGARTLLVKRQAQILQSGDTYQSGEILTVSLNDTSGFTEAVYELNGAAFFRFGICTQKRRYLGITGILQMPTDYSPVFLWGGWATEEGVLHLTSNFSLVPSIPDPTVQPTFGIPPTVAPTRISSARYSVLLEVALQGISGQGAADDAAVLSKAMCDGADLSEERCSIIRIGDASSLSTVSPLSSSSSSSASLSSSVWASLFGRSLRGRALTSLHTYVTFLIDSITYPEEQSPVISNLVSYVRNISQHGFRATVRSLSNSALSVSNSTVTNTVVVSNTDMSYFDFSCDLGQSEAKLYWSKDPATDPRYIRAAIVVPGRVWVAGGFVQSSVQTMVDRPNNVVFALDAKTDRVRSFIHSSILPACLQAHCHYHYICVYTPM